MCCGDDKTVCFVMIIHDCCVLIIKIRMQIYKILKRKARDFKGKKVVILIFGVDIYVCQRVGMHTARASLHAVRKCFYGQRQNIPASNKNSPSALFVRLSL